MNTAETPEAPVAPSAQPDAPRGGMKRLAILLIALVLGLGIYARFCDLGTHFTHVDDIGVSLTILESNRSISLEQIRTNIHEQSRQDYASLGSAALRAVDQLGLLAPGVAVAKYAVAAINVPRGWTYAPLQFVTTPLLISEAQDYRTLLFWGRVPSFVLGILGLFLILRLHRKLHPPHAFAYGLVSLCLLAFSWENIIYAKQMSSYAIGVVAAELLLIQLLVSRARSERSRTGLLWIGAVPALLCYAQYQMLFLAPAYFLALLVAWRAEGLKLPLMLRRLAVSGGTFVAIVLPLYMLFVRKLSTRGLNWNIGPHHEFLFSLPDGTILERAGYVLTYLGRNSYLVLQSNLAFIPQGHPAFAFCSALLMGLLAVGCLSFCLTRDAAKRVLGTFFFGAAGTWLVLLVAQKITLSPTRHSLILLPFMALLVSEGVGFLAERAGGAARAEKRHAWTGIALAAALAVMFLGSFKQVIAERRDPFSEAEIKRVLHDYRVGTVAAYDYWTWNLDAMHLSADGWRLHGWPKLYFREGEQKSDDLWKSPIALVAHRAPLTPKDFETFIGEINATRGPKGQYPSAFADYDLLWSKEASSNVEVDFLPLTLNGANAYHCYIMQAKQASGAAAPGLSKVAR